MIDKNEWNKLVASMTLPAHRAAWTASQRESDRCYNDELRIENERVRREAKIAREQTRRDNEMPL